MLLPLVFQWGPRTNWALRVLCLYSLAREELTLGRERPMPTATEKGPLSPQKGESKVRYFMANKRKPNEDDAWVESRRGSRPFDFQHVGAEPLCVRNREEKNTYGFVRKQGQGA